MCASILREVRRQRQEVYIPLIHRPGEEAQVDFFEVVVELGGEWLTAWAFLASSNEQEEHRAVAAGGEEKED